MATLRSTRRALAAGSVAWLAARPAAARGYDPLETGPQSKAADPVYDITLQDAPRQRVIPLRIAHRASRGELPVILFSHGLGGNRHGASYLERRWRARGYVTVFMQHPGSDDAAWRDDPADQRLAALRGAATGANLVARMRDVVAVLDALAVWNNARDGNRLEGRLRLDRIGLAGHSFGAFTAQVVAGQRVPPGLPGIWPDPRIKAALVLSPRGPTPGGRADAFAEVPIPWMVMTGSHDVSLIDGGSDRVAGRPSAAQPEPPSGHPGAQHRVLGQHPRGQCRCNGMARHDRAADGAGTAGRVAAEVSWGRMVESRRGWRDEGPSRMRPTGRLLP